jgi:hypothetical protein
MANSHKPKTPKPVRVPPHAAAGLDDEITAQPRPLSEELGASVGGEAGLSLEPEDMATRWLSEATEQGAATPLPLMASELSLTRGAETDEALTPPNFEYENTLWEQTVDLVTETEGAADQLRAPVDVQDESDPAEPLLESDRELRLDSGALHEFSLLDRVNEAGDDTIAPDIDSDETGHHARTTPRGEYGAQVEPTPEHDPRPLTERGDRIPAPGAPSVPAARQRPAAEREQKSAGSADSRRRRG